MTCLAHSATPAFYEALLTVGRDDNSPPTAEQTSLNGGSIIVDLANTSGHTALSSPVDETNVSARF
jgi:hypothetical protein